MNGRQVQNKCLLVNRCNAFIYFQFIHNAFHNAYNVKTSEGEFTEIDFNKWL